MIEKQIPNPGCAFYLQGMVYDTPRTYNPKDRSFIAFSLMVHHPVRVGAGVDLNLKPYPIVADATHSNRMLMVFDPGDVVCLRGYPIIVDQRIGLHVTNYWLVYFGTPFPEVVA